MISFRWNFRRGKIIHLESRVVVTCNWPRQQRWTVNGHKGTFWCDASVLVLDYTGSYTTV